jgi:hypothetical protein
MVERQRQERTMGVPINPELPPGFDDTPNDARPASHACWWDRPYVVSIAWEQMAWPGATEVDRAKWYAHWPWGTRYEVRCLDGGAWDRSTGWGMFATLEEAIACATGGGPSWRAAVLEMRRRGQIPGPAPAGAKP